MNPAIHAKVNEKTNNSVQRCSSGMMNNVP